MREYSDGERAREGGRKWAKRGGEREKRKEGLGGGR